MRSTKGQEVIQPVRSSCMSFVIGSNSSPSSVVVALVAIFVMLDCPPMSIEDEGDNRSGGSGLASPASPIRSVSVFSPNVGALLPDQPHGLSQDPPGGDIPD